MVSKVFKEKLNFVKNSNTSSRNVEDLIYQMQKKEVEKESFKNIVLFLESHKRRQGKDQESYLFDLLEKANLGIIFDFLKRVPLDALNSNVYLKTAFEVIKSNKIKENCVEIIDLIKANIREGKENGELTFDLIKGFKKPIRKPGLSIIKIDVDKYGKEKYDRIEVLDQENIKIYKEFNQIVDVINFMLMKLYYVRLKEELSKLDIVIDNIDLEAVSIFTNMNIKYHVNKLFRDNTISNNKLYVFPYYLNNEEDQKQKVYLG